jgi:hypothetical protein
MNDNAEQGDIQPEQFSGISDSNGEHTIEIKPDELIQQGKMNAVSALGSLANFKLRLTTLYNEFRQILAGWATNQRQAFNDKLAALRKERAEVGEQAKECARKIKAITEDIQDIKVNSAEIVANPIVAGERMEKPNMIYVWFFGCLSLLVTVFLIIFYGSAIWSAWFEDFRNITGLVIAIFNPKAFVLAWQKNNYRASCDTWSVCGIASGSTPCLL